MTAPIIRTRAALTERVNTWKSDGARLGVVLTMGALHDGHLSLVAAAKSACDRVIVTIFVNPKQFNNPADLQNYPRTEHDDAVKLSSFAVDAIYVPDPDQIYPDGFATNISVAGVSAGLCGAHRPGHFDGVATVVAKLLLQTGADCTFFGEKDYQQVQVVKRLVRDLDIPCEIIGCDTVRDPDGMALSSRNALLSPQDRGAAAVIYQVLRQIRDQLSSGEDMAASFAQGRAEILAAGFQEVEYLELRDEAHFQPTAALTGPSRLLIAARIGGVRLIDNIAVS
ncbi:MAG: pantoate--beta-alanine ligase [Alphaproteobacteria bacterium]|nr:pantoate--beta-alanine ligase [Alphaproteobacteria bacterium]